MDATNKIVHSAFTVTFANDSHFYQFLYKTGLNTGCIFFFSPSLADCLHGMLEELAMGNFLSCLINIFSITSHLLDSSVFLIACF
jgi:hypothetical protein